MKKFKVHFRHRESGSLEDVVEPVEAKSKADAIRWGKSIAAERKWWFMGCEKGEI